MELRSLHIRVTLCYLIIVIQMNFVCAVWSTLPRNVSPSPMNFHLVRILWVTSFSGCAFGCWVVSPPLETLSWSSGGLPVNTITRLVNSLPRTKLHVFLWAIHLYSGQLNYPFMPKQWTILYGCDSFIRVIKILMKCCILAFGIFINVDNGY